MASSTSQLEDVLAEAGISPEAAQLLIAEIQRIAQESVAPQVDTGTSVPGRSESAESLEGRMIRLEQKIDGLHELMAVQFAHVDHRFKVMEDRLDRERRERWGIVTAAAGAITAGLLRVFGAI